MSKKTIAILLSAFAMPGAGQFYLARYKSACLFIGIALFSVFYIFVDVLSKATPIAEKINAGEIPATYSAIRQTILDQYTQSDSTLITLFTYLLITVWLISVIDILRLKQ